MGFSNEEFRKIMKIEGEIEKELADEKFHNWQACEFSGKCAFEKVRLGLAIVKNQKYCSRNPGRKKCGAYQYLSGME